MGWAFSYVGMTEKIINPIFKIYVSIQTRLVPVGIYLFNVSKITLEQRPSGRCSDIVLLTLKQVFAHWVKLFC